MEDTSCWSHFCIVFGMLLLGTLHSKELVFLPLALYLGQSSHHTVHVIKHYIPESDDVITSTGMMFRHPQGSLPERPLYLRDILHNNPLILSPVVRPVFSIFCLFKPLPGVVTQSVDPFEQLQSRVATCLQIHNE
jgi:hypothetical protein